MAPSQHRDLLGDRIGTVFQDPFTSLNPSLKVGLQIAEPLVFHRHLSPDASRKHVKRVLRELGFSRPEEVMDSYPHQLSGGMKQRALIAAAIACEPKLVILDEPTTALDVTVQAQILRVLSDLRSTRNLSYLFISHDLSVVSQLCDYIYVLYAGEMVEAGPVEQILRRPAHPYSKGLLAAVPRLAMIDRARRLASIPGSAPDLVNLPSGCLFHPRCPFGEPFCAQDRQVVANIGRRHEVRCWKHEAVVDQSWPTDRPDRAPVPAHEGKPLVEVRDVHRYFGTGESRLLNSAQRLLGVDHSRRANKALNGVSLDIFASEILALVGESGCGKSTLGRTILRLIDPTSGEVLFGGTPLNSLSGRRLDHFRKTAQIVFQNPDSSLNPRRTVGDVIARPLVLFTALDKRGRERRLAELLDLVRLPRSYARRYSFQLSGGEKQRVGIARALACEPTFIVCDEPVSSLDVSVQATIINLLDDLRAELSLTYLFVSHDLAVVAHLADRVAVMNRGRICEIGPLADVLRPPSHPYTYTLLSSVPDLYRTHMAPSGFTRHIEVGPAQDASCGCPFEARCPVKIGKVCETTPPPLRALSGVHAIACHHESERLIDMLSPFEVGPLDRASHIQSKEAIEGS